MRVEYQVIYSKKRHTIGLTVERDNQIVVRAPMGTSEAQVDQAVESKKLWLFEKTQSAKKYPQKRVQKEFVSGETLLYLGRNYRLEIVDEFMSGVAFHAKFLISRVNQPHARELCRAWYERRARERLRIRVRHFAQAMGADYNQILVSDLRFRWGSCTPKSNLNFNWRIIKAPAFVIDYLVVHELAHLLEPNHTKRFWNIVAIQVPRHAEAKTWLMEHGNLLEVDF